MQNIGETTIREVSIPTGATGLSAAIDIEGYTHAGIIIPSGWQTANITFKAGVTATGTFYDVYDNDGDELTVIAAASRAISFSTAPVSLPAFRFIKLRSGTTGTPVDQTGSPTLTLILKG